MTSGLRGMSMLMGIAVVLTLGAVDVFGFSTGSTDNGMNNRAVVTKELLPGPDCIVSSPGLLQLQRKLPAAPVTINDLLARQDISTSGSDGTQPSVECMASVFSGYYNQCIGNGIGPNVCVLVASAMAYQHCWCATNPSTCERQAMQYRRRDGRPEALPGYYREPDTLASPLALKK